MRRLYDNFSSYNFQLDFTILKMGLSKGALTVFFRLQSLFELPFYMNIGPYGELVLIRNPQFENSRFQKYYWYFAKYGVSFIIFMISTWRLRFLLKRLKLGSKSEFRLQTVEELGIHMFFIATVITAICCYRMVEKFKDELCFVATEVFQTSYFRRKPIKARNIKREAEAGEVIFMHILSSTFMTIPCMVSSLSFFRPYDFIQLSLTRIFSLEKYPLNLKIISAIIYFIIGLHNSILSIHLGMVIIMTVESATSLSFKLFGYSHSWLGFRRCLQIYKRLKILFNVGNVVAKEFILVCTLMTIFGSIGGLYIIIKLWDEIPLLIYAACCILAPVLVAILFIMVKLASVPHRNGVMFRRFWTGFVKDNEGRRELKGCQPIGLALQPVLKYMTEDKALTISDFILNYLGTLLIMTK
ncbi:unnamed protein product [Orchesella dallaii]|uniref:Odorant receptor n=1 Tax=Orchesella dallaii TaxID=48710 RepID=A0ABP1RJY7_9HEXA